MGAFDEVNLLNRDKEEFVAKDVIEAAEVVAVYFSAHWCPPCRGFTPVLKEFWEGKGKDNGLVIIFVSSDRSEADAWSYFTQYHGEFLISLRFFYKKR